MNRDCCCCSRGCFQFYKFNRDRCYRPCFGDADLSSAEIYVHIVKYRKTLFTKIKSVLIIHIYTQCMLGIK